MKDITNDIIAYEGGELDEDETIQLFQELVNSGLAWQLQGHYGRTAADLLRAGLITDPRREKFLATRMQDNKSKLL